MHGPLGQHAVVRDALEIADHCLLSPDARQLLRRDLAPDDYFNALVAGQLYPDAIRFLALRLPKRRAVWWGCLCAWHAAGGSLPDSAKAALQATVRWVLDPCEANRRSAGLAGEADRFDTPAGWLAMSAFWSSGSMSRPELPAVPPPPDLTGRVVGGTILLSAVQGDLLLAQARFRQCLALGLQVARGENRFESEDVREGDALVEPDASLGVAPEPDSSFLEAAPTRLGTGCGVFSTADGGAYAYSIDTNHAANTVF
jgi:hypothetical protein